MSSITVPRAFGHVFTVTQSNGFLPASAEKMSQRNRPSAPAAKASPLDAVLQHPIAIKLKTQAVHYRTEVDQWLSHSDNFLTPYMTMAEQKTGVNRAFIFGGTSWWRKKFLPTFFFPFPKWFWTVILLRGLCLIYAKYEVGGECVRGSCEEVLRLGVECCAGENLQRGEYWIRRTWWILN